MIQLAEFEWLRWDGYEIVGSDVRYLVADLRSNPDYSSEELERLIAEGNLQGFRVTRPLEGAGVFLAFAQLDASSEESILGFANEYGHLTHGKSERVDHRWGERLSTWVGMVHEAHQLLTLWEALARRDRAALRPFVRFRKDGGVVVGHDGDPAYRCELTGHASLVGVAREFPSRDTLEPVARHIAERLTSLLSGQCSTTVVAERGSGRLSLYHRPNTLLGAIWLQFAATIAAGKQYRRCRFCEKWFEVAPDTARKDKLFCDDSCRLRHYRHRKSTAIRLAGEGLSALEITKQLEKDELNTPLETVERWIRKE